MMNWYKQNIKISYNRGIPLMDEYSQGYRPPSSSHKKDPRSLVNAKPEFGGRWRDKPKGLDTNISDEETEYAEIRGHLPGENVLMDQDPPTGEGVRGDEFVAQDEFNTDNDRIPQEKSKSLDNVDRGPHNMWKTNIFDSIQNKFKSHPFRKI